METSDPYLFGFSTYLPYAAQEFTPIAIDFRSAFRDEENQDVYHPTKSNKPRYYLRISPPRSSRRGVKQYIADSIIVPLGVDKTFRYKLAPSNLYYPNGRYIVEYYRHGCQIPVDKQEWLVPAIPSQALVNFRYDTEEDQIVLPLFVWRIRSVSPAFNYVSDYNLMTFNSAERPPKGTQLTIEYDPAITLDYILEYSNTNLSGVSRIRY